MLFTEFLGCAELRCCWQKRLIQENPSQLQALDRNAEFQPRLHCQVLSSTQFPSVTCSLLGVRNGARRQHWWRQRRWFAFNLTDFSWMRNFNCSSTSQPLMAASIVGFRSLAQIRWIHFAGYTLVFSLVHAGRIFHGHYQALLRLGNDQCTAGADLMISKCNCYPRGWHGRPLL